MSPLLFTSCRSATPPPSQDRLADILVRGRLVIAVDANYPPQSERRTGVARAMPTRCVSNEFTANQFTGFDVQVAVEIARQLGVEPCFVNPPRTQVVAGHWGGAWDVHIGSMAITSDRMKLFYFSQPYYAVPALLLVHKDNTSYHQPADLSGKKIGVCAGCTFEDYLLGRLKLPASETAVEIHAARIEAYENEAQALNDLALGDGVRLDAALTNLAVAQGALRSGLPVRQLSQPLFFVYVAAAVDKDSLQPGTAMASYSLVLRLTQIIQQMHAEGLLARLSIAAHQQDLTQAARQYDLNALHQFP